MPNRTNVHDLTELPQLLWQINPIAIVSLRVAFSIPFKCVNKIIAGWRISHCLGIE